MMILPEHKERHTGTRGATFRVGCTSDFPRGAPGVLEPAFAEVFAGHPEIAAEVMPDTGGVASPEVLDRYDAVIALDYAFSAASFEGVSRLAVLARWGVGYDRVDVAACTRANVILAITPDSIRRPVAEGIIALMFGVAKNLRKLDRSCRGGAWRSDLPEDSISLEGRTLGSVGLGNIAREMFRIARGIGMGRLLAYSPRSRAEDAAAAGIELTDLDSLMRECDFIAINCPLTDETRGLIGRRQIGLMRQSAYLINTARGAIVDEAALADALERHAIAGAGLDVFAEEPPAPDHPLLALDNVLLAPHAVARTRECVRDTSLSVCRSILAVASGTAPRYVVNRDVLARPGLEAKLARYARAPGRRS